jgi:hypothetical protein
MFNAACTDYCTDSLRVAIAGTYAVRDWCDKRRGISTGQCPEGTGGVTSPSAYSSQLTCCVLCCAQGDFVEILIITKDGVRREELQLKLD